MFGRNKRSSRDYPAAAVTVTGDAGRYRRSKTTGARAADRAAQAWEDRDRGQDRRGRWYRPAR